MRIALLVFVSSFAVSGVVLADARQSEQLIQQGLELRRAGQDQEAVPLFRKAHALLPTPRAAAQLGLAEYATQRWADAATHLEEALATPTDPWIKRNRKTLETSLVDVRTHVGQLELEGQPEGAEVWVGTRRLGQLPLASRLTLDAGKTELELRAPGHKPSRRTVTIRPGAVERVRMELKAEANAQLEPPLASAPTDGPPTSLTAPQPTRDDAPPSHPGRGLRIGGVVAGLVGVAGLAYGIKSSLRVNELSGKAEPGSAEDREGNSAHRAQFWGYGIGAAALISGGVLYYLGTRSNSGEGAGTNVSLDAFGSRSGGMMTLTVRR